MSLPLLGAGPSAEGGGAYAPTSVRFDGSTYLARGAGLTGAADSAYILYQFWINCQGNSPSVECILFASASWFIKRTGSTNNYASLNWVGATSGQLLGNSPTDSLPSTAAWHHVIGKVDSAGQTGQFYVDRTAQAPTWSTATITGNVDNTQTNWYVGANNFGGQLLQADLGDLGLWLLSSDVDLSVSANLDLFVNSDGTPIDLIANPPLGTDPIIFLSGGAAAFPTNQGTGGDFSVAAGSLSDGDVVTGF